MRELLGEIYMLHVGIWQLRIRLNSSLNTSYFKAEHPAAIYLKDMCEVELSVFTTFEHVLIRIADRVIVTVN